MNAMYGAYTDENLLKLIGETDDELAFAELYNRYFRLLFNYVFSKVSDQFIAQEIIQELFVTLWQQRHRDTILVCRSYLFSCAKKLIISHYRKEYTRQFHYDQWETQHESATLPTDQPLLAADLQQRYEQGLHRLPPKCKEVFVLSRQGHSNREIALQLAISEKTVEQHVTKALRLLKDYLKEHFVYALLVISLF